MEQGTTKTCERVCQHKKSEQGTLVPRINGENGIKLGFVLE
jgi:hypothetical protein